MRAKRTPSYFPSAAVEPLVQLRLYCQPWFEALARAEPVQTPDGHHVTEQSLWADIGNAIRDSMSPEDMGDPQKHYSPKSLRHKWDVEVLDEAADAGTKAPVPQRGILRKLSLETMARLIRHRTEPDAATGESPGPYMASTLAEVTRRGADDGGKRARSEPGEDDHFHPQGAADGTMTRSRSDSRSQSGHQPSPAPAPAAAAAAAAATGARGRPPPAVASKDAVASAMRDGFAMLVRAVGSDKENESWDDVESAVEWSQQQRREEVEEERRELYTAIIRALVVEGTELPGRVRAVATAVKRWRAGKRREEDVREVLVNYGCLPE